MLLGSLSEEQERDVVNVLAAMPIIDSSANCEVRKFQTLSFILSTYTL